MLVVLARHAKAYPDSPSGLDRDRVLKPKGHRQADHLARALAAMDPRPASVLASPYPRAWQTGEHLAGALGLELVAEPRLEVGCPPSALLDALGDAIANGLGPPCLVGHNPTMEEAIGLLLHGPTAHPVRVRTGEAFVLDVAPDAPVGTATAVARFRLDDPAPP